VLFSYAAQDKVSNVHLKLNKEEQEQEKEGVCRETLHLLWGVRRFIAVKVYTHCPHVLLVKLG